MAINIHKNSSELKIAILEKIRKNCQFGAIMGEKYQLQI
jgi:hypothetical protein